MYYVWHESFKKQNYTLLNQLIFYILVLIGPQLTTGLTLTVTSYFCWLNVGELF